MRPHYEIFRFGLIRGPRPQRRAVTLKLPDPAPTFRGALMNSEPRPDVHLHVVRFLANEFDPRPSSMTLAQHSILHLRDGVRALDGIERDQIDALADQALALQGRDVAQHGDYHDLRHRLATGIIALKFGAERFPGLLRTFAELYNLLDLFRDAPDFGAPKLRGLNGSAALMRPIALPAELFRHLPQPGGDVMRDSALDAPSSAAAPTTMRRVAQILPCWKSEG